MGCRGRIVVASRGSSRPSWDDLRTGGLGTTFPKGGSPCPATTSPAGGAPAGWRRVPGLHIHAATYRPGDHKRLGACIDRGRWDRDRVPASYRIDGRDLSTESGSRVSGDPGFRPRLGRHVQRDRIAWRAALNVEPELHRGRRSRRRLELQPRATNRTTVSPQHSIRAVVRGGLRRVGIRVGDIRQRLRARWGRASARSQARRASRAEIASSVSSADSVRVRRAAR
jgi:hypothetical protein